MNRKTMALTLLLITASAVVLAGLAATALADISGSNSQNITPNNDYSSNLPPFDGNMIMGNREFVMGPNSGGPARGERGFRGPMGSIEISSEFNQTINNILSNDADVKNLIAQGYNITLIRPEIKSTITANGTITTSVTAATVSLQNGTSGTAIVDVDIANAKVTKIVIITRTVIDKTTS